MHTPLAVGQLSSHRTAISGRCHVAAVRLVDIVRFDGVESRVPSTCAVVRGMRIEGDMKGDGTKERWRVVVSRMAESTHKVERHDGRFTPIDVCVNINRVVKR